MNSVFAMLGEIGPRDGLEGMLSSQMVATHHAAMECLRRAMIVEQTFEGRDQNLKHGAKLLGIYTRQLEALNKHRGKGQQKVTVEHVHVEAGGQAVVGNVGAQSASSDIDNNSRNSPKALGYAPGQVVDLPAKTQKATVKRKR